MPTMKNLSRLGVFSSLSLLALASTLVAIGCDGSGGSSSGGADSGSSGDAGSEASACATEGTGSIAVVVTGLPDGVAAKVKITPPSGAPLEATGSTTLADKPAGSYTASAERVATADPIVRTLYEAKVSISSFCLAGTQTQTVTVDYSQVPPSNKLWMTNANSESGQVLAFAGSNLTATGSPDATLGMKGVAGAGAGKALAFDKQGNLWSLGPTTTDAPLARFAAATLGAAGDKTPDITLEPKLTGCLPGLSALAFDPSGALWATVLCSDQTLRISPETLSASGEYTPAAGDFATGVEEPHAIAFDKDGNMWVSGKDSIHRYPAASLAPDQPHVPDFAISAKAENEAPLPPDALAFDKDGNLWVTNFGGNIVYKLTPAELTPAGATKELVPSIQITVSVGALLESLAFDESGGLWLTYSQGKIARLAPTQLGTSTGAGEPTIPETILTSSDIGSAGALAFFPAPATLPLYSRFE
jgi:sugar lactone lactonase YvrE